MNIIMPMGMTMNAYPFDKAGEGAHHLGLRQLLGGLGFEGELRGEGIRAHGREPGPADSVHDEAARQQLIPGLFQYLVRFACHQRLVDVTFSVRHLGVGVYLVSRGKHDYIVPHKGRGVHGLLHAVAYHHALGRGQDIQRLKLFLGAGLLNNAYDGVAYHNAHEGEVQPLAHKDYADGEDEKDQVEVGKGVVHYYLLRGLSRRVDRGVGPARVRPFPHLLGRKSRGGIGGKYGYLASPGELRLCDLLFQKRFCQGKFLRRN
jgi:hypothetical protein